jgi:drug/metabolite transporter (DMT)-like permease
VTDAWTAPGGFLLPVLALAPGRPGKRPLRPPRRHRRPLFDVVGIAMVVTVVWAGSFVVAIGTGNTAAFAQTSPVMLVVAGGLFSAGIRRDDD